MNVVENMSFSHVLHEVLPAGLAGPGAHKRERSTTPWGKKRYAWYADIWLMSKFFISIPFSLNTFCDCFVSLTLLSCGFRCLTSFKPNNYVLFFFWFIFYLLLLDDLANWAAASCWYYHLCTVLLVSWLMPASSYVTYILTYFTHWCTLSNLGMWHLCSLSGALLLAHIWQQHAKVEFHFVVFNWYV